VGGQKKVRTVVLATNALYYLKDPMVDRIIVLNEGRIVEEGSYTELSSQEDSHFKRFLTVLAETSETNSQGLEDASIVSNDTDSLVCSASANSLTSLSELHASKDEPNSPPPKYVVKKRSSSMSIKLLKGDEAVKAAKAGETMTDELRERKTGQVSHKVYVAWAKAAGGMWIPLVMLVTFGSTEGLRVMSTWWLTYWADHPASSSAVFLGTYAAINGGTMIINFVRLLFISICGLRASKRIYNDVLARILRAPMSFFDTTPIGRITNRFSKDMYTVDEVMLTNLRQYLACIINVCTTIIVISSITPIFSICLVPILAFYVTQQKYFTRSYRELKRLDSINRSPLYALLSETLDGIPTIRAFSAQSHFDTRLIQNLDVQQHAYFLNCVGLCWLAIRLELIGTIIVTMACLSSIMEHHVMGGNEHFAGLAGLSISYALSVTQSLNWSVRVGSDLEANMVSLERIQEYTTKIPTEAAPTLPTDTTKWPRDGSIRFNNVQLRYRPELPLVLKGLTLDIPTGAKVGVVGRTGAGKSTLALALLRIVELDGGQIVIDGRDISSIGLKMLRSKIALIPQDPVLFSGTVRSNLDPFDEFTDVRLYEVLDRVGLHMTKEARQLARQSSNNSLSSMGNSPVNAFESLKDAVTEGGNNFSVGQRQLLVIARALLARSSIVIMDEATAGVDVDADSRIQKVMRTEFKGATCITVAHRLNTIMDSDYILVMDDGRAAEFDHPRTLLNNGGLFRDLVEAANKSEN